MRFFFIFTISFFFLSNCTITTSTSLLGPILTASKTGSIYQATLSYGSGEMLNKIQEDLKKKRDLLENKGKDLINKIKLDGNNSQILLTVKNEKIEILNIFETEHLP